MKRSDNIEGDGGGAVVPGRCVKVVGEAARVGIPGQDSRAEPHIELIRDGDLIQAVDVTCSCGQRIRLRCLYPA